MPEELVDIARARRRCVLDGEPDTVRGEPASQWSDPVHVSIDVCVCVRGMHDEGRRADLRGELCLAREALEAIRRQRIRMPGSVYRERDVSNASNRRLTAYSNGSVTVEAETDVWPPMRIGRTSRIVGAHLRP
jgi:hypothetical protein